MRILQAAMVLATVGLAFPATAEAKGGKWFDGGGKGGGHRGGSSRAASIFSSGSRPEPKTRSFTQAPRTSARAASIRGAEGGTFTAAPRSAPRDSTPRTGLFGGRGFGGRSRQGGLSEGQDVSPRGHGARTQDQAGDAPAREPVRAASIAGNPDFRSVGPLAGGRGPDASGGGREGGRGGVPGFPRNGGDGDGRPGRGGGQRGGAAGGGPSFGSAGTGAGPVAGDPGYRVGFGDGWRNGYRVGYRNGWNDNRRFGGGYHDFYDHNRWFLSFSFGSGCGAYSGVSYYHPFRSWTCGVDYAFFYPAPVTFCYVPYGFYSVCEPVYVTRYTTVVRETVPVYTYETRTTYTVEEIEAKGAEGPVDAPAAAAGDTVAVADPKPAAGSPAAEKLLREASELFRKKEYYEAAVKFRLAALSSPDLPGPLFALGQSLLALGQDGYAARVLRKAVVANPTLLDETADLVGVYESQAEFERVMGELEARAKDAPADGDARFLLAYQKYFTGDPRCREDFDGLHEAAPKDQAVELFRASVERRFKAAADLPVIEKK